MRVFGLIALCLANVSLAQSQPNTIIIEKSEFAGNGCVQGAQASAQVVDGGAALEVTAPAMDLSSQTGGLRRLQCTAIVQLKFEPGFQVRVVGFQATVAGAKGGDRQDLVTVSTHLQGKAATAKLERPLLSGDVIGKLGGDWSSCGERATIVTTIAVRGRKDGVLIPSVVWRWNGALANRDHINVKNHFKIIITFEIDRQK